MPRRGPVSDAELEVLKELWTAGPATVRDVAAALRKRRRRLAYHTRVTLPSPARRARDAARGPREDLLGSSLSALADRVCDGTASPLVLALVRGQRFSADEIAHFRKL